MESKKINQLATELAPDLSDLTIIGDPTTGISKKITLSQMASLFTGTVEEYANFAAFPITGVADTIYVAKDTNVIYRWDSTAYVVLSPNVIASLVFNDANGFDGTIALVGSVATLTITTALTSGSVPFIGASGALTQDNSNLFFDDTNNRLGIATASPTTPLDVFGSGIIGRLNATSTNNAYLGFASAGTNKWSAGNVQSDHRFRIFSEANSAELVSVLQTGEFGIGIANPTTKFHIDGAASALIANLDANVSVAKSLSFRSDNSNRINLEVSGSESGSNAGANFFLRTYTDAGSLLATPLTITRSTGAITLTGALSSTFVGQFLDNTGASTSSKIIRISNTGADMAIGVEGSTPSEIPAAEGGIAYSTVLKSVGSTSLILGTLSKAALTINTSQQVTLTQNLTGTTAVFSSTLVLGGALSGTSALFSSNATASAFIPSGATVPTNGMYLSAANTLNFATNSTNRLSIASTGAATFTSGSTGATVINLNSALTGTQEISYAVGRTLNTQGSAFFGWRHNSAAASSYGFIETYGGSSPLVLQSSAGNVGIGSSAPTAKLEITNGRVLLNNGYSYQFYNTSSVAVDTLQMFTDGNVYLDAKDSTGGNLIFRTSNSNTERMRITSGGDINMNATSGNKLVTVKGQTGNGYYGEVRLGNVDHSAGIIGKHVSSGNANLEFWTEYYSSGGYQKRMTIDYAGNIGAPTGTNIYNASDIRLKQNITTIENGLDKVLGLNPVMFNWVNGFVESEDGKDMLGFIAQEVQDIIPEAVEGFNSGNTINLDDVQIDNPLRVNEKFIIPILVKAIQEMNTKLDAQNQTIQNLQEQINILSK